MMKILFIPTGNVFVLPDEEALRLKSQDRGNYKILDVGYTEQTALNAISEPLNGDTAEQVKEEVKQEESKPLIMMSQKELHAIAKRLGCKGAKANASKATLISLIEGKTDK